MSVRHRFVRFVVAGVALPVFGLGAAGCGDDDSAPADAEGDETTPEDSMVDDTAPADSMVDDTTTEDSMTEETAPSP